jgi:type II secretory pathway pseudopilin PulG
MRTQRQAGVTLVELIVAVLAVGILSIVLSPLFNSFVASARGSYAKRQEVVNQTIGVALLQYAQDGTPLGTLPLPYSGGGYVSTVYNPADTTLTGQALKAALTQSGINPAEINDDNYPSKRARAYQLVNGLTAQMPLYFQTGPLVNLTYQFGVIYTTNCERATTSCNPTAATGMPGSSPALTAANYASWTTSGKDQAVHFVSTLPLQKQMLANTSAKVDRVRDALMSYFRTQQTTASAGDTTNWWLPSAGAFAGATPGTNQGCRDGWYDLSTESSVLPAAGLTPSVDGKTAWGGKIEFCRDYDPTEASGANKVPHLAAIRFHSSVSLGLAPDAVVVGNNVVLTL